MRRFAAALLVTLAATACCGANAALHELRADPPTPTPFQHFWKRCFGSGHALLATRADWQAQIQQMREDIGLERVRFHGVFDDDMSVVLDSAGNYEFFNVDQVYGPLVKMGIKPIVELSFMPGLLARCAPFVPGGPPCQTVMHYRGVVMPPANYSEWTALVRGFAQHLVDRFGRDEVRSWHFEVWNELWGMPYPTSYLQLYDAAREGLKSVDGGLQVGGPVTMQCQYIKEFVADRAGKFDFVSTHLYPTDPNCTTPGNLGYGDIDCFANTIKLARSQAPAASPFFVTEYNAGLFNAELLYSSFAAAFVFRNVMLLHGTLDVWSYWTFTDIFEENGMHGAPFAGFNYGIQTNRGIKKPVYRAFELLRDAGDTWVPLNISYPNRTVTAFFTFVGPAQSDRIGLRIFLSNFAPQHFPIAKSNISVSAPTSSPTPCASRNATVYTIDSQHANAYAAWQEVGSPAYPTDVQLAEIERASRVYPRDVPMSVPAGRPNECGIVLEIEPYAAVRIDFPR